METFLVGRQWSLLGLMYGSRSVQIPLRKLCKMSNGSSMGLVVTADGSNSKYANAVYVCLYGVRKLHGSKLPAEVFFVGDSERFGAAEAARILSLRDVLLLDLLPFLSPSLRRLVRFCAAHVVSGSHVGRYHSQQS